MDKLHGVAFVLLIVGGLNIGLSALGLDVVKMLLGAWPAVEMIVYVLIGLSAIYEVAMHKKNCKGCGSGSSM